jgi:phage gp29-like protein
MPIKDTYYRQNVGSRPAWLVSLQNRLTAGLYTPVPIGPSGPGDTALSSKAEPLARHRIRQDIQSWTDAIRRGENYLTPDRSLLSRVYYDILLDAHLKSIITTRKLQAVGVPMFLLNTDGEPDMAATRYIRKPWFREVLLHAMDVVFWGHALIDLKTVRADGLTKGVGGVMQFDSAELIDHANCFPEQGAIKQNQADAQGVSYRDLDTGAILPDWADRTLELWGGYREFGLLMEAAPWVYYKRAAVANMADLSDRFGIPYRVGKTDTSSAQRVNQMRSAFQDQGAAAWAVIDTEEEVNLLQGVSGQVPLFGDLIKICNDELSKLMLGNTLTTSTPDKGGSRAQGEVHERLQGDVNTADRQLLEFFVNEQLLPLMVRNGFPVNGFSFGFREQTEPDTLALAQRDKLLVDMGFALAPEYITQTYGVELKAEAAPVEAAPETAGKDGVPQRNDLQAEAQANLRGSVGGVQGILELQASVAAGTTGYEAGIAILELIYGYGDADARRILGQPKPAASPATGLPAPVQTKPPPASFTPASVA